MKKQRTSARHPYVLLLNAPTEKKALNIEGRCVQTASFFMSKYPPYTLAQLAACILEAGGSTRIMDCPAQGITITHLVEQLRSQAPDHIVINCSNMSFMQDIRTARACKKVVPRTKVTLLGTFPTTQNKEILSRFPDIDHIIIGEPEPALPLFFKNTPTDTPNVVYRHSTTIIQCRTTYIQDLNTLPYPAWHLVDLNAYRLPFSGNKYLIVLPSRGCPYQCTYCASALYYGKKLRTRSAAHVVSEIEHCKKKFGIDHFFFWSDTFTCDTAHTKELCELMIKKKVYVRFMANSRVDTISRDLIRTMSAAGLFMISLGIESGDRHILRGINKGTTLAQVRQAVQATSAERVISIGHCMLGFPQENTRSLIRTKELLAAIPLDFISLYFVTPIPGTPLFKELYPHTPPLQTLLDLAQDRVNFKPAHLSCRALRQTYWEILFRFYCRPIQIARIIRAIVIILKRKKNIRASTEIPNSTTRTETPTDSG